MYNDVKPQRILVYRDGVSEGSFSRVQACEIQSIRNGYTQFVQELNGGEKAVNQHSCGCKSGCVFCGPLITFVACMSRNNAKIVPADDTDGIISRSGASNVHSGTCVDSTITDTMSNLNLTSANDDAVDAVASKTKMKESGLIYSEPDGKGYDFLLTAHGAGLGTSKPVHYRIILNENAVYRPQGPATPLTKDMLERATYEMSFQYSTATKVSIYVTFDFYQ